MTPPENTAPPSPGPRSAWRPAAVVTTLVIAAVFARALAGGFVYDDLSLIVRNPGLHDAGDVVGLWTRPLWGERLGHYRPLTAQLLAIGWQLGGGRPWAIHALALLLHLWAAWAVLQLWRSLGGSVRGGATAALLFALHPAQAESVGWCAALNDVLWGACALNGLLWWVRYRDDGCRRSLLLALLLAAAAMAAKEAGAVVPVLYVVADVVRGRRLRWVHCSLAGVLLGWYLVRAAVFGDFAAGLDRTSYTPPDAGVAATLRVATGLAARLVAPVGTSAFDSEVTTVDAVLAVALFAAVGVAGWRLGVADRVAGRVAGRLGGAAIALAVALPPLTVGSLGPYPLADRYLYVGCAGLALLLTAAVWRREPGRMAVAAIVALVVLCATGTFVRLGTWSSEETFVATALQRRPDDPRLHYMRGRIELERAGTGDPEAAAAALRSLDTARRLLGGDLKRLDHLQTLRAEVATALAWCAMLPTTGAQPGWQPDWPRVEREFLDVTGTWPDRSDGWVGLGVARAATGRLEFAEVALRRAIELDPAAAAAHHNLARVLYQRGDRRGAREHLLEAVRLVPTDQTSRELLRQLDAGR